MQRGPALNAERLLRAAIAANPSDPKGYQQLMMMFAARNDLAGAKQIVADGIANGASDIYEYTLPPQADPLFIHATERLDPQIYYEVHLNVFDCTVQQVPFRPAEARAPAPDPAEIACTMFPNPVADVLQVYVPAWTGRQVQFRLRDAYGRLLQLQTSDAMPDVLSIPLAPEWPAGIYYLEATDDRGQALVRRFVRVRG